MQAFEAVVDATGCIYVILTGHSMGGTVIAEAARLMPKRVSGLIGFDTFENIEYPLISLFDEIPVPVISVNSDMWPIDWCSVSFGNSKQFNLMISFFNNNS